MPIDEQITLAGEGAANPEGSAVATPPVIAKRYLSADTIGKLKACGVRWQIRSGTVNVPGGTPTQIVGVNEARVLLVVFPSATSTELLKPVGMTIVNGFDLTTANRPTVLGYDEYGPLVGVAWNVESAVGGNYDYIEVAANQ